MKRIISIFVLSIFSIFISGCKKFLNIDSPSSLSGNNYWKSQSDVEQYVNGLYELFRESVFRSDMTAPAGDGEFPFFSWSGDMRGAPIVSNASYRSYISYLANNNINTVFTGGGDMTYPNLFNASRFKIWTKFYNTIAAANIAVDRIPTVPSSSLSESEKNRYIAEAVFVRNISYFFMVRLWGDVPYYTQPYFSDQIPRTSQVTVLQNCLADMGAHEKDLSWTYSDPSKTAVRAMRGSALVLMMHMNMWLACFDSKNATSYYTQVSELSDEFINENNGSYALLPLSESKVIFKGRSKEGLFEIPQNSNYGESFGWSAFSDNVLYAPYKNYQITSSYLAYKADFMRKLFPEGAADDRVTYWYQVANMYSEGGKFLMLKFANVYANQNAEDVNPDDNQTIFRVPDVYLLRAEALQKLGDETGAKAAVNVVRARANASLITSSGSDLDDDIFLERCREFMGEGLYWYDVVRTKRIINTEYKFGYHCTVSQFAAGAWTWPIDASMKTNNPYVTLNSYWL